MFTPPASLPAKERFSSILVRSPSCFALLQADHLGANGNAEDVDEEEAVEHAVATAGPEEDAQLEEHLSEAVPEHKDEAAAPAGDDAEEDWGLDEDEPGQ